MNSKLNVALLDLNHVTTGLHTRTMPLSIGLIASYLLANIPKNSADVRLYKFADELDEDCRQVRFDVVGISMYCWNSGLNIHHSAKICSDSGGPNKSFERVFRRGVHWDPLATMKGGGS